MSGVSKTYSTQRKIWKRAESTRYSGSSGIGSLRDRISGIWERGLMQHRHLQHPARAGIFRDFLHSQD